MRVPIELQCKITYYLELLAEWLKRMDATDLLLNNKLHIMNLLHDFYYMTEMYQVISSC